MKTGLVRRFGVRHAIHDGDTLTLCGMYAYREHLDGAAPSCIQCLNRLNEPTTPSPETKEAGSDG